MQITKFKDAIGITRAEPENWLPKLTLFTTYAPTTAGVPREYSRENVIELGVIAALRRAGCPLRTAAGYAGSVIRSYRQRQVNAWFAFPAGNFEEGRGVSDPSRVDFAELAQKSPHRSVSLIHVGEIVATVEQLFAKEGATQ